MAGVIKHFTDANHKPTGELVIAADLTATGKAGTVSRNFGASITSGDIAKCRTDVAADVAAGPSRRREPPSLVLLCMWASAAGRLPMR